MSVYKYTERETDLERERNTWFSNWALDVWAIFLGVTSTVSLWQTVTLPVLRTAPPVRACLGPQTQPSVAETGFCGGSVGFTGTNRLPLYTSMYAAENSIWLYCTSSVLYLLESGRGYEQYGEMQQREDIFQIKSLLQ